MPGITFSGLDISQPQICYATRSLRVHVPKAQCTSTRSSKFYAICVHGPLGEAMKPTAQRHRSILLEERRLRALGQIEASPSLVPGTRKGEDLGLTGLKGL